MKRAANETMKKVHRRALSWLLIPALMWTIFVPAAASADVLQPTQTQQQQAIKAVAELFTAGDDLTAQYLERIEGATPPIPEQTWRAFPAIRKIGASYQAAERAAPGGGERFLAVLSQAMAQDLPQVRFFSELEPYLDPEAAKTPPTFDHSAGTLKPARLEPRVRAAIAQLADFAGGTRLGGMNWVVHHYCDISRDRAFDILATSSSDDEALLTAFSEMPPEQRVRGLTRLVHDTDVAYGRGARQIAALDPFRASTSRVADASRTIPVEGYGPGPDAAAEASGGGGGGGRSTSRTYKSGPVRAHGFASTTGGGGGGGGTSSWHSFTNSAYTSGGGGRGFTVMRARAGGFGGIVFGNAVTDSTGLAKVTRIAWIPSRPDGDMGRLFVWADGKGPYIHGPVRQEDAYAAHELVFGPEQLLSFSRGEGVGLFSLGLQNRAAYFDIENHTIVNRGSQYPAIVHPALEDTQLGWASMMVDVLLIESSPMLTQLVEKHTDKKGVDALRAWYAQALVNWKVTDSPLEVTLNGTALVVRRNGEGWPGMSETERSELLLSIQGFVTNGVETSPAPGSHIERFARLLPTLIRASYDFDRLNRFAGVVALYRWAQTTGGTSEPPERTPKVVIPGSIVVNELGVKPGESFTPDEVRARQLATLEAEITQLRRSDGSLKDPRFSVASLNESLALPRESIESSEKKVARLREIYEALPSDVIQQLESSADQETTIEALNEEYPELTELMKLVDEVQWLQLELFTSLSAIMAQVGDWSAVEDALSADHRVKLSALDEKLAAKRAIFYSSGEGSDEVRAANADVGRLEKERTELFTSAAPGLAKWQGLAKQYVSVYAGI